MLTLVIIIIVVALIFDFINGFHDAANSIATVVSTRVLSPRFAVLWAAFFNFVAAFGFGTHVAKTAGACTLLGTALAGIPVSTTHTITGAIMGVGATRRLSAVRWGVANDIVWAWVLTIPFSALIAALTYKLFALFGAQ